MKSKAKLSSSFIVLIFTCFPHGAQAGKGVPVSDSSSGSRKRQVRDFFEGQKLKEAIALPSEEHKDPLESGSESAIKLLIEDEANLLCGDRFGIGAKADLKSIKTKNLYTNSAIALSFCRDDKDQSSLSNPAQPDRCNPGELVDGTIYSLEPPRGEKEIISQERYNELSKKPQRAWIKKSVEKVPHIIFTQLKCDITSLLPAETAKTTQSKTHSNRNTRTKVGNKTKKKKQSETYTLVETTFSPLHQQPASNQSKNQPKKPVPFDFLTLLSKYDEAVKEIKSTHENATNLIAKLTSDGNDKTKFQGIVDLYRDEQMKAIYDDTLARIPKHLVQPAQSAQ